MEENLVQERGVTFFDLIAALKEKVILIIAVTLVCALSGWFVSAVFITPQYEASVNMIVNAKAEGAGNVTNDNISSAQKLVDTYAIIIKSNTVLNQVIEKLNLDMTYKQLYNRISVGAVNNTQVMKVSIKDEDAETAKKIVATIAEIAPDIVVEAVEAGSCKVISQVDAGDDPVSPNVKKNIVIAGFLGFVICAGIVILKELLYDYIVDDTDAEKKLGLSVLGIIPELGDN